MVYGGVVKREENDGVVVQLEKVDCGGDDSDGESQTL